MPTETNPRQPIRNNINTPITNQLQALAVGCALYITAPDDERAPRCMPYIQDFSRGLNPQQIAWVKKEAMRLVREYNAADRCDS